MRIASLKSIVFFLSFLFLLTDTAFAIEKNLILDGCLEPNPKEIVEEAYKNAQWDDLSVEIRLVKTEASKGFVSKRLEDPMMKERMYYVSPSPELTLADISAMDVFYNPGMEDKLGVNIYLKKDARARFKEFTSEHIGEFAGVLVNGKLRIVIKINESIMVNRLTIGEFSAKEALSIVKKFFKPLKSAWPYLSPR